MGFMLLALFLIAGTVAAVVAQRRSYGAGAVSGLDAEAEANRWVVRLGGSLSVFGAGARADRIAARELSAAAERHRTARLQLAAARTPAEYVVVTRTAQEGMHHVRAARTALGIAPSAGPRSADLPPSGRPSPGQRPHHRDHVRT